ncbi:MAG: hypothetical protein IK062_06590 [Selenomonadaceae bacterium]|nr:hypothetical protein [Selenomonadaceae bacterium]
MFLAKMNKEQQETFLNLAYTMVYADGRLDEAEKRWFDFYKLELSVDVSKAHKVDFEKSLEIFDKCEQKIKNAVFFEIFAIALVDDVYADEERELVEMMKNRFGISNDKMLEMREGLRQLTLAYDAIRKSNQE